MYSMEMGASLDPERLVLAQVGAQGGEELESESLVN